MDTLWKADASPTTWGAPPGFSIGYPRSGDVTTGAHPTVVGGWWFQSMVDEIRTVILAAGLVYDPTDTTQLVVAIQQIFNPTYELREDGGSELREDGSLERRQ
jgi:hypothetical protein